MLTFLRSRVWNGFLLAALLLSLLGTVVTPSPARASVDPRDHDRHDHRHTPLGVEVTMPELPAVGKSAEVTIVVSSTERAEGVQVGIVGSDGLRIDGERGLVIDLAIGEARTLQARVTPEVAGNHSVAANVSLDFGDGTVWGDSDAVYFNSGDGTASEGFTYQGDPMSVAAVPGPGNTMKFESEAFPDGSMPAPQLEEDIEIPVDTGGPGGQGDVPREGDVALAAGMLTIRGTVGMTDRDGSWKPQKLLVQLFTKGQWFEKTIALGFSDFNGNFAFNVHNPGKFRMRLWTYFDHDSMNIGAIRVVRNDTETSGPFSLAGWSGTSPALGPFPDGEQHVGAWQPNPSVSSSRAWWIYQDLVDGFFSTWNQTPPGVPAGSRQPDGVTVEWQPDSTVGAFYLPSSRRVKLRDFDSRSTVLHEYGHAIMHNVYGSWPVSNCPSPHSIEKPSGSICAWSEGWASFFSIYVNEDPIFTNGCALPCTPPSWNLEYRTTNLQWSTGDLVEGNVAAGLWDFIDEQRDGSDKTDSTVTPFWKIWDVFFNHNHNTFFEFWGSWSVNVPSDTYLRSLATLHESTIDYGWETVCGDWTRESDDTHAGSGSHAYPEHSPHKRYFCTDGDKDWYTLNVEAGETYIVETSNLSTAPNGTFTDTTLTLYRLNNNATSLDQLAFDDNGGSEPFASRIEFTAPADVELRVAVRQKDGLGHPLYSYWFDFAWVNDNVAPSVTAPTHQLMAGSTLGNPATGVYTTDVKAEWTAEDPDDGIAYQSLQGQVDAQGFVMLEPSLAGDVREHSVPLTIDTTNQLQVSATDTYDATSGYATGESFEVHGYQETDFSYEGHWTSHDDPDAWRGSYLSTDGSDGATAFVSFTGGSVALVGMTAPDGGYAEIYIDGELHGRADFYAEREMHRQVVFAVNGLSAGAHEMRIFWTPSRNEQSSGYQLNLDGLIALD